MIQKNAALWLRGLIVVAAVMGVVIFFVVVPIMGRELVVQYPEFRQRFWPWLIFLWLSAVPCFLSLIPGWQLFGRVEDNSAFCRENANCLKKISRLLLWDSAFFLGGNTVFFFLGMNHPSIFIAALFLALALAAIGIAAAALEGLVLRAARLKEDSDLTI
jgi:drug/metabolite transporter (DMT)-like permease